MYKYEAPFTVVEMPINREGKGPEMDQSKVVKVIFQVWDSNNATFKEFNSEARAEYICRKLNKESIWNG